MTCARREVGGRRRRGSAAISFSGELAYEVNVPGWHAASRCGRRCWRRGAVGITPYGTEAMHVLRAEKGYVIVGQETDGTVTPLDLGLDWMVSKTKPTSSASARSPRADTARAGPQAARRPAADRSRTRAAGGRAARDGPAGADPGADARARDVELPQRGARPVVRAGAAGDGRERHGETVYAHHLGNAQHRDRRRPGCTTGRDAARWRLRAPQRPGRPRGPDGGRVGQTTSACAGCRAWRRPACGWRRTGRRRRAWRRRSASVCRWSPARWRRRASGASCGSAPTSRGWWSAPPAPRPQRWERCARRPATRGRRST